MSQKERELADIKNKLAAARKELERVQSTARQGASKEIAALLSEAEVEAEAVVQRAHDESRAVRAELATERAALADAQVALKRKELMLETAVAEATAAADAAHAEARRVQETRDILADRTRLAATREEVLSSKEGELSKRRAELEAAEQRAARLTNRLQNGLTTLTLEPHKVEVAEDEDSSDEEEEVQKAVLSTANAVGMNGDSAHSPSSLALYETLAKGSNRLTRLEGIVAAIARGGSAEPAAVTSAQHSVKSLRRELTAIEGSFETETSRGELSAWEGRLGQVLETVVGMQRQALGIKNSSSPS
jgi:hypothetical protein